MLAGVGEGGVGAEGEEGEEREEEEKEEGWVKEEGLGRRRGGGMGEEIIIYYTIDNCKNNK